MENVKDDGALQEIVWNAMRVYRGKIPKFPLIFS